MQHRCYFEAVHRMPQDVRNPITLFGDLPLTASENFAQILLPVVRRGLRSAVVGACLTSGSLTPAPKCACPLWPGQHPFYCLKPDPCYTANRRPCLSS